MIWHPIPLMTLIDIVIAIIALASLILLYRQRIMLAKHNLFLGAGMIVIGFVGISLFYLIGLFIMWGLPLFITHHQAMAIMGTMHLDYSWVVVLMTTICIFSGFVYLLNKMFLHAKKIENEIVLRKQTEDILKIYQLIVFSSSGLLSYMDKDKDK